MIKLSQNNILNNLVNPKSGNKVDIAGLNKKEFKDENFKFCSKNGIIQLFFDNIKDDLTFEQSEFYNDIKFPNYDDLDDIFELRKKAKRSIFFDKLNKEIPINAKVLEAGCGTGQLCNYLSNNSREIVGIDLSNNSLELANNFSINNNLKNIFFFKMDILNNFFKSKYFDVIISNGVLHHTENPYKSFVELTKLLKDDGIIVIGLYHRYGRVFTFIKQIVFKLVKLLIGDYLNSILNKRTKKKYAWYKDQYQNPKESSHTFSEMISWFQKNNIEILSSIPFSLNNNEIINGKIFVKNKKIDNLILNPFKLFLFEISQMLSYNQIRENGFFIIIGKKIKKNS